MKKTRIIKHTRFNNLWIDLYLRWLLFRGYDVEVTVQILADEEAEKIFQHPVWKGQQWKIEYEKRDK